MKVSRLNSVDRILNMLLWMPLVYVCGSHHITHGHSVKLNQLNFLLFFWIFIILTSLVGSPCFTTLLAILPPNLGNDSLVSHVTVVHPLGCRHVSMPKDVANKMALFLFDVNVATFIASSYGSWIATAHNYVYTPFFNYLGYSLQFLYFLHFVRYYLTQYYIMIFKSLS